jgi:hypothetical protein
MIFPIGTNCNISDALKNTNNRICSYPLDWIIINIDNLKDFLILLLTTDIKDVEKLCKDFFDIKNGHTYIQDFDQNIVFVNDKYNISFPHDKIDTIIEKYTRRIIRLINDFYNSDFVNIVFSSRWEKYDDILYDIIKSILKLRNKNIHFYIINGFENEIKEEFIDLISLYKIDYKEEYVKYNWNYDCIYKNELTKIFSNIKFN